MATPNKLSRFFQEIKRRNVHRLMAVYGGTAFIIFEASTMIFPRWGLPDWIIDLVLYILILGAIITFVFGWIYDIHPGGGIVKTEPADKIQAEDVPKSSNSWKVASYISFAVIVGLIVLNVIPRSARVVEVLEKSIAVLPFESLSNDPEKQYQADGVMDAILLHLSKIEELRVISRTSVEQYRETNKTINEICEELDVAYILEGSFRRYGDQARLIVQLIQPGREEHVWAKKYDRDWADIFTVESAVAQAVAGELQAIITPKLKERIEKAPTSNLLAYEFYQKAIDEQWNFRRDRSNLDALKKAESLYRFALDYDSTFALSYAGLGWVYINMHYWPEYFNEDFMDSVLILANTALQYNSQLSEAYTLRGRYYLLNGLHEEAIKELNLALEYNPNSSMAYFLMGSLYLNNDNLESIKNYHNAILRSHDKDLPSIYRNLAVAYSSAGFLEKERECVERAFKLDRDTTKYYSALCSQEYGSSNFITAIEYGEGVLARDSTNINCLDRIGASYAFLGKYEKALDCYERILSTLEERGELWLNNMHRIGYIYSLNGMTNKANHYFNLQIDYCKKMNELERGYNKTFWTYYDLAASYAYTGNTEKAIENLRIFNKKQNISFFMVLLFNEDPLLEKIRNNPDFKHIARDLEAKYQVEHERVRQWLEANDML